MADICTNCGSTKEIVAEVILKSDHFEDMRQVATVCGACFWGKSRITTYVNEEHQRQAEEPFNKAAAVAGKHWAKKQDEIILEAIGAGV